MKSLKGHMMEVAKSEHGHLLLLALFDTVDDTVLVKKVCMSFRKFPHNHVY
jgi:pumilio family protein 6